MRKSWQHVVLLFVAVVVFFSATAEASYRLEWAEGREPEDGISLPFYQATHYSWASATLPNPAPPKPVVKPAPKQSVTNVTHSVGTKANGSANAYVDPWGCEASHAQQWSGAKDRNGNPMYWGKYQFDRQTWAAHGGDPAAYGSAPESEQDRVAARVKYDAWPNC